MTEPKSTSTGADADARLIAEVIALRADMIRTIKQAERLLEARDVSFESVIVTRRERRTNLTRRRR